MFGASEVSPRRHQWTARARRPQTTGADAAGSSVAELVLQDDADLARIILVVVQRESIGADEVKLAAHAVNDGRAEEHVAAAPVLDELGAGLDPLSRLADEAVDVAHQELALEAGGSLGVSPDVEVH